MKYCGIDLHSNNSVVSVVDEEDHVVAEKRLPNDLGKIIGLIKLSVINQTLASRVGRGRG